MANIGYIRVSTQEQNTARQEEMLNKFKIDRMYVEKISGKNTNRPELKKLLGYVREGDTVIVESYSRFSRSTRDLLDLVEQLNQKGVNFISIKENVDTTTPQGRLIMTIFAGLVQFEREQTLQRQAEGIAIAKQEGKYKGRKPIDINRKEFEKQVQAWKEGKQTATQAMKNMSLKPNTFYRRVREYEATKAERE